ncbi:pseudouridine synthase [Chryseosolibacter indicus]|uniref:Pseudouridine synthase n=1 Tax=Chryseosolibacter indicus TaxID=2782351 RepID=A0ABS5VPN5_9BACT|nr:pseudouridine synthase [Chryseosolibacter indicus]MBT1703106.1 rRNA pseudouridine synthase [Chryseosolibacter indicus]
MPKGNSSGRSSGRRGNNTRSNSSENSFSGRKKSSDRPFKKTDRSSKGEGSFGTKRSSGRSSGGDRPFKKSANSSYKRRDEDPDSPKSFSKRPGSTGRKTGSRTSKSFDKPFRDRRSDSEDEPRRARASKPFGRQKSEDSKSSGGTGKSLRRRGDTSRSSNRTYDKKESSARKSSPRSSSKSYDRKRDETSSEERHSFFKKERTSDRKGKADQKDAPVQSEKIRLNRFIANSGVCSRREADELIAMGLISVNGKTITELGYKVNPGDEVRYENKILRAEKPVYILLNKPKGYITTTDDPQERNTVMHIIGSAVKERIYPVGRLDRNTTGLLLLTNDGELADKLMHPSYNVKKIYKVELDRPLTKNDFQKILDGVRLEEGKAAVDDLAIVSDDGKTVGVELHIGWNRVVRRIFESLDYQVVRLDRSVYAGLDKKDLGRGEWRYLTKEEVVRLKHFK